MAQGDRLDGSAQRWDITGSVEFWDTTGWQIDFLADTKASTGKLARVALGLPRNVARLRRSR
jgi:hypothetical protein